MLSVYKNSAMRWFVAALAICIAHNVVAANDAERILKQAGVHGGLIVHVGCGDGRLTAALRANASCVVFGLDTDAAQVRAAREWIDGQHLAGSVSVNVFDGKRLPLIDNLVNLLVVSDAAEVSKQEMLRVLAPGGVMLSSASSPLLPRPERKPWPDDIDEWGHFLHGPDNNALSNDLVVGPPKHMQWLSGPEWARHHDADKGTYPTIRSVVSARGRLFYLLDETRSSNRQIPSRWALVARDAFSGVQLWKKPIQTESYPRELDQVWRQLIADGDRVYAQLGTSQPISELDAATGDVLRTFAGSGGLTEAIKDDRFLFVLDDQQRIIAFDLKTGKTSWSWAADEGDIVRLTLAAADGRVFVKTTKAACCLTADAGTLAWRHPLPESDVPRRLRWPRERLIVADGVVLVSFGGTDPQVLNKDNAEYLGSHPRVREYAGRLAALDAVDGKKLWESAYRPNLESAPGEIYVNQGQVWLGPDFSEVRDLHSGKAKPGLTGVLQQLWTDGHHYRCYPGKATSRFLITAKRGIELFDMTGQEHSRNNWVRSTCRVGITPCNGLIYASPHSCGCYTETLLHGFWALASERPAFEFQPAADADRLLHGPAFSENGNDQPVTPHPDDWPTYRGNNTRSATVSMKIPADLTQAWRVSAGGRLSALTVADEKVFAASIDEHAVIALDANTGRVLWRFHAGGRVDSPPTFHNGLVLFGSHDGCVYCLRASDGQLRWRFLSAPCELNSIAFEQVESLWPVHGSVLVDNGVAYVAAGRSSYLDGGIVLYGLKPDTGQILYRRQLQSVHTGLTPPPADADRMESKIQQNWLDYKTFMAPDHSDSFAMDGALTDILSADGDSLFMRQLRFEKDLSENSEKYPHLFSTFSLLDSSEHHRSYWVLGTGDFHRLGVAFPWIIGNQIQVPFGLMLAFDDATAWSLQGGAGRKRQSADYVVVAMKRPDVNSDISRLPDFQARSAKSKPNEPLWRHPIASRPRAILSVGKTLFVAGMKDADFTKPLDDWKAGIIRVLSTQTGSASNDIGLPAPPVWDGMAAARGKLYLSLEDGSITCFTGR